MAKKVQRESLAEKAVRLTEDAADAAIRARAFQKKAFLRLKRADKFGFEFAVLHMLEDRDELFKEIKKGSGELWLLDINGSLSVEQLRQLHQALGKVLKRR